MRLEPSDTLQAVYAEVVRARAVHPPMHSPHEGLAIIHEEFRELMFHVYSDTGRTDAAFTEAVQLAAMAVRYVVDLRELEPTGAL